MLNDRIRQRQTVFNISANLTDNGAQGFVLALTFENIETFDDADTRINHSRELTREDDERLEFYCAGSRARNAAGRCPGFFDCDYMKLLLMQFGQQKLFVISFYAAVD